MTTVLPPQPEGLYDTYVYYENNFTSYDYPEGVWWKYLLIIQPGLAILHNGLPERTDYNDPYNLYLAIESALLNLLDILVQTFCARTIWRSKTLSSSVKWFLLADVAIRIESFFYHLFTIQCTFKNYPFSWLLVNQIWSTFASCEEYIIKLWAFGLSFSRIFAIFFNGLHYRKVERLTVPYIATVFLMVSGVYLGLVGKGRSTLTGTYTYRGFIYFPNLYAMYICFAPSRFFWEFTYYICYLGYTVVGLSLALDSLTLWKIRKMKKLSSSTKNRADFKLAVMMITTHCFNAIIVLYFQLNSMLGATNEPLIVELINLPAHFFSPINGAIVIAFNYPFKEKNKNPRLFDQRPNQAPTTQNQTEETQVTKLD